MEDLLWRRARYNHIPQFKDVEKADHRLQGEVREVTQKGQKDRGILRFQFHGKSGILLEAEKLNETIMVTSVTVDMERMMDRFTTCGNNTLFINFGDMMREGIAEMYRKRNTVEHCFRTISMRNLTSQV